MPTHQGLAAADSRTRVVLAARGAEIAARSSALLELTSEEKARALLDVLSRHEGVSCEAQTRRLLRALRQVGWISVMEAERYLDIRHPPSRILELDRDGHPTARRWVRQVSERGREHRTMAYTLVSAGLGTGAD